MANVTLLHYNNYFSRIVRKESSYQNYILATPHAAQKLTNVNFVPGDGVTTSIILGTPVLNMDFINNSDFDYLIVSHVENNVEVIDSRWFIMDEKRTRNGQYEFTLRRDVIVDNYEAVIEAPMFVEKAQISDTTDTLLYNNESMTYNQIKVQETPLKDKTTCGWVVGYIPQDAFDTPTVVSKDISYTPAPDYEIAGLSNWQYWDAVSSNPNGRIWSTSDSETVYKVIKLKTKMSLGSAISNRKVKVDTTITSSTSTSIIAQSGIPFDDWSPVTFTRNEFGTNPSYLDTYVYNNLPSNSTMWSLFNSVSSDLNLDLDRRIRVMAPANITALRNLDGGLLKDTQTNNYYRIQVVNRSARASDTDISQSSHASSFLNQINNSMNRSGSGGVSNWYVTGNHDANSIQIGLSTNGYEIILTQTMISATVTIDNVRSHVLDAPYDMFCIPYSDTKKVKIGSTTVTCSKELAVGIAQEIAADSGSGSIYDTQLLPYCPSSELVNKNPSATADDATFDLDGLSIDVIYDLNSPTITLGAVIWCTSCNRSFDINEPINVSNDPLERKIENECDMYRLCSGNYQGAFEFSAAKSFGVSGFHVDCTFKPFNPYIHVIPKLGGLYGDFNQFGDARGLICGGDFSLTQLSNAWANYELQNKNYQAIFDRQIQNMDVNNSIARQEAAWQMAAGVIGGGVSGAISGATVGGGVGAAVGGVLGAGTNALGGILDMQNMQKRQEEARSYAIDMYGYQLGNIKAIPTSISKTSAITANTKIFPFVEKYTCTDTEKNALRSKLIYDGMTIMVIGKISDYIEKISSLFYNYIKGEIIFFEEYNYGRLKGDNHMALAIYEEVKKGLYLLSAPLI